jgi:ADP-ribose pyrophosphatase YjhB (NUDIX family)
VLEGREVEACPRDDFVLWHDPKVVTIVVVETPAGVLLGRRGIEPGYGLWCLPGGFVNDDEHPADSAARECVEELGVPVEIEELLGVYHIRKQGAPSMVGIAYTGRVKDGASPRAGAEMLEVAAFPRDRLPELAFSSHIAVIEDWLRSRERPEAGARTRAAAAPEARSAATPPMPSGPRPSRSRR